MRCLATLSWFRRNLVVLRRGNIAEGADAKAILCEIGQRSFAWYGQAPGIRSRAFSEPLPSLPAARAARKEVPDAGRSASATAARANPDAEVISGRDNYLSVLGQFHAILAPELYLEIGVRNGGSLALARGHAVGVDPAFQITEPLAAETRMLRMTSDEFSDRAPPRSWRQRLISASLTACISSSTRCVISSISSGTRTRLP